MNEHKRCSKALWVRVAAWRGIGYEPTELTKSLSPGWSVFAPPQLSDIHLLGDCQRVVDLNAEIAHGALDLGVAEK